MIYTSMSSEGAISSENRHLNCCFESKLQVLKNSYLCQNNSSIFYQNPGSHHHAESHRQS